MSQRLRAKAERAGSHFQRALAQLPMPTPMPPPAAATAAASPAPTQQGMAGGGSGATDAMRGGPVGGTAAAAAAATATATLVEISVDLCRTQRLLLEGLGGSAGLAEQDGLLRAGIGYLMRLRPLLGGQQQPPPQGSSRDSSGGAAAAAVSHFCACIGSPCLRQCVHGAPIGGSGGGGACCLGPADRGERATGAEGHAAGVGAGAHEQRGR
jgi:hypothetical protein